MSQRKRKEKVYEDTVMSIYMDDIVKPNNGKEPTNHSPVCDYCRKLMKDGVNPKTKLHVYRGSMLCLIVNSIEEGSKLKIIENKKVGPKFAKYHPYPFDRIGFKGLV